VLLSDHSTWVSGQQSSTSTYRPRACLQLSAPQPQCAACVISLQSLMSPAGPPMRQHVTQCVEHVLLLTLLLPLLEC